MRPGMLLAVEPMIALGTHQIRADSRDWPIYTADGSLAVHYEADVMVTEYGPRDLTEGMQDLPVIVG
jgi:methionyl aminopeptidase